MLFLPDFWSFFLGYDYFCNQFFTRSIQGTRIDDLAYQLGLSEENSFFGLETLLAVAGLIIGVILLTALGYFSKYLLGRVFINLTERTWTRCHLLMRFIVRSNKSWKPLGKENRAVFKEVCLVEYPRKGCLRTRIYNRRILQPCDRQNWAWFYLCICTTTPNPTSGFLLLVKEEEIHRIDVSVGDGMKMLISGGAVVPSSFLNVQTCRLVQLNCLALLCPVTRRVIVCCAYAYLIKPWA